MNEHPAASPVASVDCPHCAGTGKVAVPVHGFAVGDVVEWTPSYAAARHYYGWGFDQPILAEVVKVLPKRLRIRFENRRYKTTNSVDVHPQYLRRLLKETA